MGGLDPAKILVVLIIALIVLGPERLPGAARQLGGAWRELNRLREKFEDEVRSAVPDLDLPKIPTSPSRAVSGYLTGLVSGLTDTSVGSAASTDPNGSAIESVYEPEAPTPYAASRGATSWYSGDDQQDSPSGERPLLGEQGRARRSDPRLCRLGHRRARSRPTPCSCWTSRA